MANVNNLFVGIGGMGNLACLLAVFGCYGRGFGSNGATVFAGDMGFRGSI